MISANERRHHMCNVFFHWLRPLKLYEKQTWRVYGRHFHMSVVPIITRIFVNIPLIALHFCESKVSKYWGLKVLYGNFVIHFVVYILHCICRVGWLCADGMSVVKSLTLVVLNPEYSGRTNSLPLLLMPWLPTSTRHQQPWFWFCWMNRSLFS